MRIRVWLALSTAVAAGLAASALPSASAARGPEATNRAAVVRDGSGTVHVDVESGLVRYRGSWITQMEVGALNRSGRALFGDFRVEGDTLVAAVFDTQAELDAYAAAKGAPVPSRSYPPNETPDQRARRLVAAGEDAAAVAAATLVTPPNGSGVFATIPGCPLLTYGSRDYDDANCGGPYLASFPNDSISWYGDYGRNDSMTSLDIENNGTGCIVIRLLYNNVNHNTSAGLWRYYGIANAAMSLNLPSTQNDRVSSSESICS